MKNSSESFFDDSAKSWDENPLIVGLAKAVSSKIMQVVPLNDQMTAMEFGCGTGLVGMALAPHLKHLVAIDGSENMLEALKKKVIRFQLQNVEIRHIDPEASTLPFENAFDLVFSSMVLHHIKDTESAFVMFSRTIRSGGYLAVADLDTEDGEFHESVPVEVHHFGFNRTDLAKKMEAAGFTCIKDVTAHVLSKQNKKGQDLSYPVFLMVAQKP